MVWSDPEIKSLSKEFVPVADEVYYLYPENPQHLERAGSRPDHQFFRKYGESMPKGDWNAGTKQGIYMIGPDAEYLEGRFAASGEPEDIKARLKRALERWKMLKKEKGYAAKAIPTKSWSPPPGLEGELVLRVNLRDLPRGEGDKSGARRQDLPDSGNWSDFTKWAWNENWIALPVQKSFVPTGSEWELIDPELSSRIAREVIVDNVRGQAPEWQRQEVKLAELRMHYMDKNLIEYKGRFEMEGSGRSFKGDVYGQGTWDGKSFVTLDLVVLGIRAGKSRFNQRENDLGPAPMGVTLSTRIR